MFSNLIDELYKTVGECLEAATAWAAFIDCLYQNHKEIGNLTLQEIFGDPTEKNTLPDQEIEKMLSEQNIFKYFYLDELINSASSLNASMFYNSINWLRLEFLFIKSANYTILERCEALSNLTSTIKLFCSDVATWGVNICEALGLDYLEYWPIEDNVEFSTEEEKKEPEIVAFSIIYKVSENS